jgi:lipid-A-disaccharide synthase-like uncharacterized protein
MLQKIMEIVHNPWELFWMLFGFAAQSLFAGRFVWQLFVSEKKGRSTVPLGFWILSLLGGVMLLVYACKQHDPVFIAGQGLGVIIYIRNLVLISRRRKAIRRRHPQMAAGENKGVLVKQGSHS